MAPIRPSLVPRSESDGPRRRVSDDDLVVRAGTGDTEAFGVLLERHQGAVYRYCWRIFRNHHTAEDLTQEFFVKLFRNAAKYEPSGHYTTYMYRVLTNLCFDALRRRKRRRSTESLQLDPVLSEGTDLEPEAPAFDLDAGLVRAEAGDAVHNALERLPEHVRKAVELREFEGLSYREIARVLDLSLNEVKVILHRGRKMLARSLARTSVGRQFGLAGRPSEQDYPRDDGLSDLAGEGS
jgi:RNA polymerase sigma-70 factor (ECF subfamily)